MDKARESALRSINEAYTIISSLSVSGDVVDVIASVRSKLRKAAESLEGEEEGNGR